LLHENLREGTGGTGNISRISPIAKQYWKNADKKTKKLFANYAKDVLLCRKKPCIFKQFDYEKSVKRKSTRKSIRKEKSNTTIPPVPQEVTTGENFQRFVSELELVATGDNP